MRMRLHGGQGGGGGGGGRIGPLLWCGTAMLSDLAGMVLNGGRIRTATRTGLPRSVPACSTEKGALWRVGQWSWRRWRGGRMPRALRAVDGEGGQ